MTIPEQIDSLTEKQQDVLGYICIGEDGGHHPRTIKALEARGLIESYEGMLLPSRGQPAWMAMKVTRYTVTLPVHVAWTLWCCDNFDEEGNRVRP